jgi:RNA 2',3'-cyclic 3'-phosphodiesterase
MRDAGLQARGEDSGERARLFVALQLPEEVRETLARWRLTALEGIGGLRVVPHDDLHVTLCFLGWREAGEIDQILGACGVVAGEPACRLRLDGAVWLPSRRPRVLAAAFEDLEGGLGHAQSALSDALQAGGWYVPEPRRFMPHVTVARVAKGARIRALELPPPPRLELEGSRVTLYRSRLGAGGARYESLGTVALGSAPGAVDPVSVVRRFHAEQSRSYAEGAVEGVRELLSEDVVWHVPGRSAIAGEHRGRDAVLAYFDARRRMSGATFRVTVHGIARIGERVVQLAGGRAEFGGRETTWETVGVFTVRDGRIAECWLVPFDQDAFDEIWS